MTGRALLLATLGLLAAGACTGEPSPKPPPPEAAPLSPPTPFDDAEAVLDSVEPPEQTVLIPPSPPPPEPQPAPPPAPPPRPAPVPRPAPPPLARGPSGSCDVRGREGYCFAFTGEGWSPETARARCASAPGASFAASTCPATGRIATCTYTPQSAPGREVVYTYYAPYDMALAELACPGTFERLD